MKTIGHGPSPQPCIILACIVLKVDFIWHLSSLLHSGLYPVSSSSSLLVVHVSSGTWVGSTSMLQRQGVLISTFVHVQTMQQRHLLRIIVSSFGNKMHYGVQPRHLQYTDVMLCHVQVSLGLGQGWQVFATWRKKTDFFSWKRPSWQKYIK